MYTVSQAARLTGVPAGTLRAWERRYRVIAPSRTQGGYRLYDATQIEQLREMAARVHSGMRPAQAAASLISPPPLVPWPDDPPDLVAAAESLDPSLLHDAIATAFAAAPLEDVITTWLLPQLDALGAAWASGRLSVAHEHFASAGVMGALASRFHDQVPGERGPTVLVGLPPGASHELMLFAFAVCLRRLGADVLYLGADVPLADWHRTAQARLPRAVVLGAHCAQDARAAGQIAASLEDLPVSVWVGGSAREQAGGATPLPHDVPAAARHLHRLLLGAAV